MSKQTVFAARHVGPPPAGDVSGRVYALPLHRREVAISSKRRATPLTADEISDAALVIVRTEGLDSLSMRRLAAELDAWPTSVYHHVGDKQQLVQLVLDRVHEMIVLPADDLDWREWMEAFAANLAEVLRLHPGVAEHLATQGNAYPQVWITTDRTLAVLRRAGFGDEDAGLVWLALMELIGARVRSEQRGPVAEDHPSGAAALGAMMAEHAADMTHLVAVVPRLVGVAPTNLTDELVALLLDGAAARLAESRSS